MRARDQSSIFRTSGKFHPDYGLLLELHTVTLVACSYALLRRYTAEEDKLAYVYTTFWCIPESDKLYS